MIKAGDIVRYSEKWCSEGERKYLHVVKESVLNPVTGEMSRWLIQTINSGMTFAPSEVVEDYMIEKVGWNVEDYINEQAVEK